MTWLYLFVALALIAAALRLFVHAPPDPPEDATDDDILALARAGRKIDAIRWHRLLHGTDLKDAKAAVEALGQERP